jgi:hypothetical protein
MMTERNSPAWAAARHPAVRAAAGRSPGPFASDPDCDGQCRQPRASDPLRSTVLLLSISAAVTNPSENY